MSDVHYGKSSQGALQNVFAQASDESDVLVICGDLTDYGLVEEAKLLAKDITATVRVPVVTILGNHDYESGEAADVKKTLEDAGITVLDGDTFEVMGIGFAGVKGFAGGFGRGALGPWGETIIKQFVHEAIDEALKLESALARLRAPHRVALLHYSPIRATVEGEPPEIFPFLGCSRLEEPLTRFTVTAVFHGHAHNGALEGRTSTGVPVYNVALPLLRKLQPGGPLFRIFEVPAAEADPQPVEEATDSSVIGALSPDTAPRRRVTDRNA
jgi:Icc-related predicted phosphoesterase